MKIAELFDEDLSTEHAALKAQECVVGKELRERSGAIRNDPIFNAAVAELADARDLKSRGGNIVSVRFRSAALPEESKIGRKREQPIYEAVLFLLAFDGGKGMVLLSPFCFDSPGSNKAREYDYERS